MLQQYQILQSMTFNANVYLNIKMMKVFISLETRITISRPWSKCPLNYTYIYLSQPILAPTTLPKAENSFIYDFISVRLKRYLVFDLEWSKSFCCES